MVSDRNLKDAFDIEVPDSDLVNWDKGKQLQVNAQNLVGHLINNLALCQFKELVPDVVTVRIVREMDIPLKPLCLSVFIEFLNCFIAFQVDLVQHDLLWVKDMITEAEVHVFKDVREDL